MAETKEVLAFAVELGDQLLRNGGEVYRVEDTVLAIMQAYDVEDFDVYVLSNGIFASANEQREDACSMVRHVPLAGYHLTKVDKLNQISRDVCAHVIDLDEAWKQLKAARELPEVGILTRMFFGGLGSGCFTLMFGGGPFEAVAAFIIGFIVQHILEMLNRSSVSKFMGIVLCSIMIAVLTLVLLFFGLGPNYHTTIIGSIMPLVPGIALTTSIRDLNNGDYLSGTIHLIDALMTALCIAAGVGVVIILATSYLGGILPL
ncbi:MAG: threonine/serine exporter family protein [Pseudobutyrivibrio sp.]|nr:threonine/serine exporter family protein [Pseudobutyrivibrio sp.]